MSSESCTRRWIAAGVRHELMMRALPAVRHDLAAPLSLMRMQLLMLRRQVAADTPVAPGTLGPRVALFESQVSELSHGLRDLRDWELPLTDPDPARASGLSRAALVAQGVGLMRAAFDFDGIVLQIDPALEAAADDAEVFPGIAALRYLLLGALCHLHDMHPALAVAGALHIAPLGEAGLRLSAQPRPAAAEGDDARAFLPPRVPRHLLIDAEHLQALADELGHAITLTPEAVALDLRRA